MIVTLLTHTISLGTGGDIFPSECDRISIMRWQHWLRSWISAAWQQAITWTNADQDICQYLASLGPNKLVSLMPTWRHPKAESPKFSVQIILILWLLIFLSAASPCRSQAVILRKALNRFTIDFHQQIFRPKMLFHCRRMIYNTHRFFFLQQTLMKSVWYKF